MFTGIIESVGKVASLQRSPAGLRLTINEPALAAEARVGDSVSVNGVCLTVTDICYGNLTFEVVTESLRRSNLGDLTVGSAVNLESSLRPTSKLGGHFVMGHVDAVGSVTRLIREGESRRVYIRSPEHATRYMVEKGSVAVNGVSLTIVEVECSFFAVVLIPFTRRVTNLGELRVGSRVNIEVDIMAKYVEKFLEPYIEKSRQMQEERLLRLLRE